MRQLLQSLKGSEASVKDVPVPIPGSGAVLVRTAISLVSSGTERTTVEFASKSLIKKARARPDLVRDVMDKAKREGLLATFDAVRSRLDQPLALGYSCAGTVISVGKRVTDFQPGDRVACAGSGYAVHAEFVSVPQNLVVKLPEGVDFESGAFVTLGAIAMHGIRLAQLELGESVAVVGLGLVGSIAAQLAKAAGCRVLGFDPNPDRCRLAKQLGCYVAVTSESQLSDHISQATHGNGVDEVIICAATSNSGPIKLAGRIARDRATVVAVGDVGMEIPRRLYYDKELDFRVSRSYGPGRYDSQYEEKGHDYPIGYVRWTENRNMQAFLQLVSEGKVDVAPLITHRFPIQDATKAYDLITGNVEEPSLAVMITYEEQLDLSRRVELRPERDSPITGALKSVKVGLLGAGRFATSTLLPAMNKVLGVEFVGVCTATGLSARHVGDKFRFRFCATDESELLSDAEINTVVIATRHNLHARQVVDALNVGKSVFCEKPLALNEDELASIVRAFNAQDSSILTVGFNRRFAVMAEQLKAFVTDNQEPLVMHYRINAGFIPQDHWVNDLEEGGGRIIGEVCHFVDFLSFVAGALPVRVRARALPNEGRYSDDNAIVTIDFVNGSIGTITYVANGDKSFPKERVEVFGGGTVAVLDDFRRLELTRNGRKRAYKSRLRQDKGHQGEWEAFAAALRSDGPQPIPFDELIAATLTTFRIVESLHRDSPMEIDVASFMEAALA